ncbi:MAG: hypothetical protein HUU29_13880 [Planctomycetaceae bacterium]|nr:hypothetical protein [Planctomycetaceae bacterium]
MKPHPDEHDDLDDARSTSPEKLSLLLDGRLPENEARDTQRALQADKDLNASFDSLKETRDMVRASRALATLPPGFDARLRMRIHSADVKLRSEDRLLAQEAADSRGFNRAMLGMGAFAAGVAIMLTLDGAGLLSLSGGKSGDDTELEASLGVSGSDAFSLTKADVEPMLKDHIERVAQLQRKFIVTPTVDPAWTTVELEIAAIASRNDHLLRIVQQLPDHSQEDVEALKLLSLACKELDIMAHEAQSNNAMLQGVHLGNVFGKVVYSTNNEEIILNFLPTGDAAVLRQMYEVSVSREESGAETRTPGTASSEQNDNVYFNEGFKLYNHGEYSKAWSSFLRILESNANSPCFAQAAYLGSLCLLKSGDACGAYQLIDVVSQVKPEVLLIFRNDEIENLVAAAANGDKKRSQCYPCWTNKKDGSASLVINSLKTAQRTKPVDTKKPGEKVADIRARWIAETDKVRQTLETKSFQGGKPASVAPRQSAPVPPPER